MSQGFDDFGDLEPRDQDAGEVFMLSFAALGSLALLAADAEAAHASALSPLSTDEVRELLRGHAAPATGAVAAPPAAHDTAFLAAIAAFTPPSGGASVIFPVPADAAALAAPSSAPTSYAIGGFEDDAIGSSSPAVFGAAGLTLRGDNLIVALDARAKLTIGGDNDVVLAAQGDTIDVLSGSSVTIEGGGARVTLGSSDTLSLSGVGYQVRANGPGDVVTLQSASQAIVYGDGVAAHVAAPDAALTLVGAGNRVDMAGPGATATLGGDAAVFMSAPGAVNLMDASTLQAHGAGAAYLGANDFVSLFGAFDVYAPGSSGLSVLSAFGADDTLHVNSSFADIASLLGASTQADGATTLHLNSAGDALTLVGLDKTQVFGLASSGHIRLD